VKRKIGMKSIKSMSTTSCVVEKEVGMKKIVVLLKKKKKIFVKEI